MRFYYDFETNGLLRHRGLKIHCMAWAIDDSEVVLTVGHNEVVAQLHAILDQYQQGDTMHSLCAHNLMGFDLPVLRRFTGRDPVKEGWGVRDTKVLGSLFDPEFSGTHSLEDWGTRVKEPKTDYPGWYKANMLSLDPSYVYQEGDEWREYCQEMGTYCAQDVNVLRKISTYLKRTYEDAHPWGASIAIEHGISEVMFRQAHNGWHFRMEHALQVESMMEDFIRERTERLQKMLTFKCEEGNPVEKPFKKDGKPSAIALKALGWTQDEETKLWHHPLDQGLKPVPTGQFTRVSFCEYDLDSRQQVIALLIKHGWKPTETTETGLPKFTEDSIVSQMGPVGTDLSERFVAITRMGQLRGWMKKVREDGRIEARAFSQATPTARMRHSVVVNVARPGTKWGPEMRACFGVDITKHPGWRQVGVDAAGLELRMLAHYMGDAEFTRQVVTGDIHWYIAQIIGLVPLGTVRNKDMHTEEGRLHDAVRNVEKTWIYGLIYGAGDAKLGSILSDLPGQLGRELGNEAGGALTKQRMMIGLPKYGRLMERIEETLFEVHIRNGERKRGKKKRSWLLGLDGRRIYVRHDHAALNSLLQSAGSILVKAATVFTAKQIEKRKLKAKQIGHFHDEAQYECVSEDVAKEVGRIFIEGVKLCGKKLGVRCPLDGEYKIGTNWAECH